MLYTLFDKMKYLGKDNVHIHEGVNIKLVFWYFENFNHPFLVYVLISVVVILLFLLNKENAGYVLVNYLKCTGLDSKHHGG